jgi:hypothetical protein
MHQDDHKISLDQRPIDFFEGILAPAIPHPIAADGLGGKRMPLERNRPGRFDTR